jgi:hypothetical protein
MDAIANFAKVGVSTGYNSAATSIVLNAGNGAKLPAAPFNLVWWNSSDYPDPSDDPNVEIVRVTAISTDTLTITRAQEGTSASTKNTASKTYQMIQAPTAKTITDTWVSPTFTGNVGMGVTTPGYFLDAENIDGMASYTDILGGARTIGYLIKQTNTQTPSGSPVVALKVDYLSNYSSDPGGRNLPAMHIVSATQTNSTAYATAVLMGLQFIAAHQGSGAMSGLQGINASVRNVGTATTTTLSGVSMAVSNSGGGTATTANNILIGQPSGGTGGTWGNIYGINLQDQKPSGSDTLTNPPEAIHIASQTATGAYALNQVGSGIVSFTSPVLFVPTTVAALPAASAANKGSRAVVTNATATTFASVVAGGGSNTVPVFSNGTNWLIG